MKRLLLYLHSVGQFIVFYRKIIVFSATTLFAVAAFAAGILMDSFGSLKTRLVGLVLFISGAILVTIATPGETDR